MAVTMIPVTNPTSESKRGVEVRLDSLPPGARFRSNPLEFGGFVYQSQSGTFLYATSSRARVRLKTTTQADRKFKTGAGQEVVLPGQNYRETDWAPDSPVEFVDMDPNYKVPIPKAGKIDKTIDIADEFETDYQFEKETVTMTASSASATPASEVPATNAITMKWKYNLSALAKALALDGPTTVSTGIREKIQALYEEAIAAEVSLDPPEFDDPVFADMVFDKPRKPQVVAAAKVTKVAVTPPSVKGKEAVAARQKAKSTGRESKAKGSTKKTQDGVSGKVAKSPKVAKATKVAKAKVSAALKAAKVAQPARRPKSGPNACKDGCGTMVKGNFKQGHDAIYKSLVLQVEREELPQDKLPAFMRKQGGKDGAPLEFRKIGNGYRCTNSVAKLPTGR